MSIIDVQLRIPIVSQYIVVAETGLKACCSAFFCSGVVTWFGSATYFDGGGSTSKA